MEETVISTLVQKTPVSNVYSSHRELSEDLAGSMAHNINTTRKYYKLVDKQQSSLDIAKNLPAIMREKGMPKEKAATNKVDTSGDQEPQSEEVEAHMEIKRIPWTEEDINMVRDIFQQEIKEECITMECVRERINGHPRLVTMDARKVYHRVRSVWRRPEIQFVPDEEVLQLPTEQERHGLNVLEGHLLRTLPLRTLFYHL